MKKIILALPLALNTPYYPVYNADYNFLED